MKELKGRKCLESYETVQKMENGPKRKRLGVGEVEDGVGIECFCRDGGKQEERQEGVEEEGRAARERRRGISAQQAASHASQPVSEWIGTLASQPAAGSTGIFAGQHQTALQRTGLRWGMSGGCFFFFGC